MLQITCQTGTSEHAATRERHVPATPLCVSHAQTGTVQLIFFKISDETIGWQASHFT